MSDDRARMLFSAKEIAERVAELGTAVTEQYEGGTPPVLVGVLKGSSMFLADLVRRIPIPLQIDFMSISSYAGAAASSGVVKIVKDLESDVSDRDVLIVEDIVDTGLTLNYLRRTLGQRGPRSLKTVTLLDKVARRIVPVPVDFSGFEIGDVFALGYGLDWQGRYRNVPDLLAVDDIRALASNPSVLVEPLFPHSR